MIYNASGVNCKEYIELQELFESNSSKVLTKSCTINSRKGNDSPRYYDHELGSINSMGLPNLGYDTYISFANVFKKKYDKPYLMSICGLTLEDNIQMIQDISKSIVDGIEINLSCPNVEGKPQVGYDFETMKNYLDIFDKISSKPFGIKLPPYFDPVHFDMVSSILNNYNKLEYITCINSIGNGLIIDIENNKTVTKPRDGLGGIGGKYCLPIALSNVREFYKRLNNKYIVGCGGIENGEDMFKHILCGAKICANRYTIT